MDIGRKFEFRDIITWKDSMIIFEIELLSYYSMLSSYAFGRVVMVTYRSSCNFKNMFCANILIHKFVISRIYSLFVRIFGVTDL